MDTVPIWFPSESRPSLSAEAGDQTSLLVAGTGFDTHVRPRGGPSLQGLLKDLGTDREQSAAALW